MRAKYVPIYAYCRRLHEKFYDDNIAHIFM